MKRTNGSLLAVLLVSSITSVAQAGSSADWNGYLVRLNTPGFVIPGTGVRQECVITPQEIIVTTSLGEVTTTEHRALDTDGNFGSLIKAAAKGEMTTAPGPTDAPLSIYQAVEIQEGGDQLRVDLGSRNDGLFTQNAAPEAMGLKHLIDLFCPGRG